MTAQPFTLATSCMEPDQEFASLLALARACVSVSDAAPGRPALSCRLAELTRGGLPGGQVVRVALEDAVVPACRTLVGFAFIPGPDTVGRLERALRDVSGHRPGAPIVQRESA